MALVVTERLKGTSKAIITLTGTEAEVAGSLATGAGLSAAKYKWNGDITRILWEAGVVGAVSICYLTTNV